MASLTDLPGAAGQILAAFATQLETDGIPLPARQYVAPGADIPWDGEQFVCYLQAVVQGQPGAPFGGTFVPEALNLSAQFALVLLRSAPMLSGEGPLPTMVPGSDDLNTAGQTNMTDISGLVIAASKLHQAYQITGPGEGFAMTGCVPLGPQGGLVGSRLSLAISLT